MTKLVPALLVAVALVAGGVAAAQLTAGQEPEPRLSLASASVPGTTTAETTGTTETVGTTTTPTTAETTGEDVSGPCDEAEHANDPRCTGAAGADDRRGRDGRADDARADDRGRGRGRGSGGGGDDDDHADDRGGSNSGHGGGDDD